MLKRYGSGRDFNGYTESEFKRLKKADRIEIMVSWFNANYEDPVHRMPYNSREGGYQWIHGGPYDALEVLSEEFEGAADFVMIEQAVDEIQSDGQFEWAPQNDGDFEDFQPEESFRGYSRAELNALEQESRAQVIKTLDELQQLLRPVYATIEQSRITPGIGHNNPPEDSDLGSVIDNDDWLELSKAADGIRAEAASLSPKVSKIEESESVFKRIATTLAGWILDRVNAGIDNTVAVLIGIGIVKPEAVLVAINSVALAISKWLHSLAWPF